MLIAVTVIIFIVYLQPWHIPIKYLLPGTIFLIAFQVIPVVATLGTSFTNFGDAHRGTKQDAITAIQTGSVAQVEGSAQYVLTIATPGDAATGELVSSSMTPKTKTVQKGDATGLTPVTDATVTATGKVTAAPGLTILNLGQAANRSKDIQDLSVPTDERGDQGVGGEQGVRREGDASPTTPPATASPIPRPGRSTHADESRGFFVDQTTGDNLPQGWMVTVGLDNFTRTFTDPCPDRPAPRHRCMELRLRDHDASSSRSLPDCSSRSRSTRPVSAVCASTGC